MFLSVLEYSDVRVFHHSGIKLQLLLKVFYVCTQLSPFLRRRKQGGDLDCHLKSSTCEV